MYSLKNIIIFIGLVAFVAAEYPYEYGNDSNEMRSPCNIQDPLGCLQMKAWNFISSFFNKDTFNVSLYIDLIINLY